MAKISVIRRARQSDLLDDHGTINDVYVAEDARRTGVGTALVDQISCTSVASSSWP